jgi:KTSC domain-containing protein
LLTNKLRLPFRLEVRSDSGSDEGSRHTTDQATFGLSAESPMRIETIKSDLISKIGYEQTTMRVLYTDGTTFDYFGVPLKVFAVIVRAKSPGRKLLDVRDDYKFKQV